jgi:hypothetical protein
MTIAFGVTSDSDKLPSSMRYLSFNDADAAARKLYARCGSACVFVREQPGDLPRKYEKVAEYVTDHNERLLACVTLKGCKYA